MTGLNSQAMTGLNSQAMTGLNSQAMTGLNSQAMTGPDSHAPKMVLAMTAFCDCFAALAITATPAIASWLCPSQ
jgi:hypothetical protein